MVCRAILSFFIFATFAFGLAKETQDIKSHYKSLARDFLIYEYVKHKKPPLKDVRALRGDIYRYRGKIKRLFDKKLRVKSSRLKCSELQGEKYITNCVKPLLNPKNVEKMSEKKKKKLYLLLSKKDKKNYHWVKAMMKKDTFLSLQNGRTKDFLKVFNGTSYGYKHKVFDKYMKANFAKALVKTKGFDRFVMSVAMDGAYKKLPISLTKLNQKNLSFNGAFYLGLMSLKQDKSKKALEFFKTAQKSTKRKSNKNKALFWQYQVTKNQKTLLKLANGSDLNFYTFWAKEKLGLKNVEIIQPKPRAKSLKGFDITDPFVWAKLNDTTRKMDFKSAKKFAQKFYTVDTLPHYTFILERASRYKKNFYITPYEDYLKGVTKERKTLIYSIGRQESRFVPASVSTSYALGLMQFMPFLARATAKDEKIENFKYFDMFQPSVALKFANNHFDFLEQYLFSPLFIAYAYNGGISFTKSLLTKKRLFRKGKYEPFMSMELVHYRESREYGKKVLVNYVLYGRLFGLRVSIFGLLDDLTNLDKSDVYRKR